MMVIYAVAVLRRGEWANLSCTPSEKKCRIILNCQSPSIPARGPLPKGQFYGDVRAFEEALPFLEQPIQNPVKERI